MDRCPKCDSYQFSCGSKHANGVTEVSKACERISHYKDLYEHWSKRAEELQSMLEFVCDRTRSMFFVKDGELRELSVLDLEAKSDRERRVSLRTLMETAYGKGKAVNR